MRRLLCDEMLKGLARWLRAAGYDTEMCEPGTSDRLLIHKARDESRLLVTRDRKLLEHKEATDIIVLLQANELEECVREISKRLTIHWLLNPFSRCLVCNQVLEPATPEQLLTIPDESLQYNDPILYCNRCDKVYWQGSHVKRMRRRLEQWQAQFPDQEPIP